MAHSMATMEKPETRGRKKLMSITIRPGKDGGHEIEHRYAGSYEMNEGQKPHIFGKNEGEEMMAHIAKHAKVKMGEAEEHEPMEEKEEQQEGE